MKLTRGTTNKNWCSDRSKSRPNMNVSKLLNLTFREKTSQGGILTPVRAWTQKTTHLGVVGQVKLALTTIEDWAWSATSVAEKV